MKLEIDLSLIRGSELKDGRISFPIAENEIVIFNRKNGTKGASMRLWATARKEIGNYGETHIIKQFLNNSEKAQLAENKDVQLPIIGNIMKSKNEQESF